MKKVIKNRLFLVIITMIITASVTVYAAGILASEISFTPKNSSWTKENGEPIKNVDDALNELYKNKSNSREVRDYIAAFAYRHETIAPTTWTYDYDMNNYNIFEIDFVRVQSGNLTVVGIKENDETEVLYSKSAPNQTEDTPSENFILKNDYNYKKISIRWERPLGYANSDIIANVIRKN